MKQLDMFEVDFDETEELAKISNLDGYVHTFIKYKMCWWKVIGKEEKRLIKDVEYPDIKVQVLYPVNLSADSIKQGYKSYYYLHKDILYSSIFTNTLQNYHLKLMEEKTQQYHDALLFGINQNEDATFENEEEE